MSVSTLPRHVDAGTTEDWAHLFCPCNPDLSLCGTDISDELVVDGLTGSKDCPMCVAVEEMTEGVCPRCGQ